MERFNLNTWLEDKSRKIVTRDGKQARIICYDVKQGKDDCYVPIIALVDKGEEIGEMSYYYSEDGSFLRNPNQTHNLDLFFADEEEELTEFEKALLAAFNCIAGKAVTTIGTASFQEDVDEWSKPLLDLAIKELGKENPYSGNQKQEWSEEDKSMYIRTLGILGKCYMGELPTKVEEELKWFKSIEPQSHWKPSEEQMNALDKAKNNPSNYYDIRLGLQSLYNDLLKF